MGWKQDLRVSNRQAWANEKKPTLKNLDSNMKKNTTFIKKCKTSLAADYRQQLLNDIQKLSLEKYISEIVAGVLEGMLKCKTTKDIQACVEVVSALHQRFPTTFTLLLTSGLAKALQPSNRQQLAAMTPEQQEKEETSRISRQRTYLRLSTELWLVSVLRNVEDGVTALASTEGVPGQDDGMTGLADALTSNKKKKSVSPVTSENSGPKGFVYRVLRELLGADGKQHINLPLVTSFVKNFGQEVLGIIPRKQRAADNTDNDMPVTSGTESDDFSLVTPEQRQAIKEELIMPYYESVVEHLKKEHTFIQKMNNRNHDILFSKGQLSDDVKQRFEKNTKTYEKLLAQTETLTDGLDLEMPDLPEEEGVTKVFVTSTANSMAEGKEFQLNNSVWEDDDARKFYEDLPDLGILVPGIFTETTKKKDQAIPENEATEAAPDASQIEPAEDRIEDKPSESDLDIADNGEMDTSTIVDEALEQMGNDDSADVKPAELTKLDLLLNRLTTLGNRDMIDSAAVEFCYVNSKNARKRLVKALFGVPRQRVDLLPYYGRLIAILNQYFPDIGEAILSALTHEFRGLQRKKTVELTETRVKNIRFIAELTKFKVAPLHTIFSCLKVALDDFTNQNIDIVCNLLETCGRYLLRTPETNMRMQNMLEIMMRKKNVQHLDNRQVLMVENAYYMANPPERTAVVEKQRPPMELYIRNLIYLELTKKSMDKSLKSLRKLSWDDPAIQHLMNKIFQKVWKVKYSNVHLLAILASGLNKYHPTFGVQLIDTVVEEIRVGLEQNIFKHNQRRIATVKYLGELYNYRMVDSPLIFDTLYTIVTLGHDFGRPARDRFCPMDAPNDFFRIRLCCTLLDTCGMCFDRGRAKKKLDHFLVFFQMYIFSKAKPPMDVDFMISDTFETLRPHMQMMTSYDEANSEVDVILLDQLKSVQGNDDKVQEDGFEDSDGASDSSSDAEDDDEIQDLLDAEDENVEENEISSVAPDEEDEVVVLKSQEQRRKEEDDEFEKEFSKMISDSIDSRKHEKKAAMLDVPIPMNLRGAQDRRSREQDRVSQTGGMMFTLLTKKGNRQQTKLMEVPSDSQLAVTTRSKQQAEREEHQQLKRLVLNYEEREQKAAHQLALEEKRNLKQMKGKRILHISGAGGYQHNNGPKNPTTSKSDDWQRAFE
ncbi:ARM repeat-containing protein [Hesseltinella vesiculosa]|uniref:ARM repeat-containing protein n=1 Tax=Hesseltinella vesiculosa TaxID=101127 RepID=A0A1X2G7E1_9FUNG|nr:ARM repeat-containing protein [Hesseltinella vesiculosa]